MNKNLFSQLFSDQINKKYYEMHTNDNNYISFWFR